MFKILFLILLLTASDAMASTQCNEIVAGYESSSNLYVVCPDLSALSKVEAKERINVILDQYTGPPDEVLIYFVVSKEFVGKDNFGATDLAGFYYTHSNELEIWPNLQSRRKVYKFLWN